MRRAAKVDANHTEIVKALRKVGCSVLSLAAIGNGCPDLLVSYRHRSSNMVRTLLMEIKRPKGKLNAQQEQFRSKWLGEVCVVRCVDDALLVLGIVT